MKSPEVRALGYNPERQVTPLASPQLTSLGRHLTCFFLHSCVNRSKHAEEHPQIQTHREAAHYPNDCWKCLTKAFRILKTRPRSRFESWRCWTKVKIAGHINIILKPQTEHVLAVADTHITEYLSQLQYRDRPARLRLRYRD